MQHEKAGYSKFLDDLCDNVCTSEHFLHHEFLEAHIKADENKVELINI